ncbi:hypothetical protein FRC03_002189 [Tulasnella sp. 419]|nr:hypothetical protein FRC03_002189 [Tulasnella sp. 419]
MAAEETPAKTSAAKVSTTDRLNKLRAFLNENNVQAYVVPSEDQHSSEYLADCDSRRAFISGFTGSAGCAVITTDKAYMFTDGRYFLQAAEQMDENWTLMKQGLPDVPTWQEFLSKNLEKNSRIGIDPTLITAADAKALKTSLSPIGSEIVPLTTNLVDQVWGEARPARPKNKVFPLDIEYAGKSSENKIKELRAELAKQQSGAVVITMLDEVAWLFNLRGSDIDFNPVFFSYALVTNTSVTLYIDSSQVPADSFASHLAGTDVQIRSYDSFFEDLQSLSQKLSEATGPTKVLIGNRASLAVANAIGEKNVSIVKSPVQDAKAIKNDVEIEGFRQCHIRDGVALARYFAWLEEQLNRGLQLTESEGASQLERYRSENKHFRGLSFTTISSTGPNGAIIHYSPNPNDCSIIQKEQVYLCDSGGQYSDGTTDVTRTWHFGEATEEEKRAFTRVLQGHIAIDTAIFPTGTTGYLIDSFARRALWQDGLDYRHGTGHGVGHFLNVHEGPQGIGMRPVYNETPLKPGMTVSNEPGYYKDGHFGIRIESIVIVRSADTPHNFGNKGYLGFEHVTMCPIHRKMVDKDLLSPAEVKWLDDYHKEVLEKVKPGLEEVGDKRAVTWLERECQPL